MKSFFLLCLVFVVAVVIGSCAGQKSEVKEEKEWKSAAVPNVKVFDNEYDALLGFLDVSEEGAQTDDSYVVCEEVRHKRDLHETDEEWPQKKAYARALFSLRQAWRFGDLSALEAGGSLEMDALEKALNDNSVREQRGEDWVCLRGWPAEEVQYP